jgi:recombination protein RecA
VLDIGAGIDVVKKSGTWYSYGEERLGQGKEQSRTFLREHPEVTAEIAGKIREHFGVDPSADGDKDAAAGEETPAAASTSDADKPQPAGAKKGAKRSSSSARVGSR